MKVKGFLKDVGGAARVTKARLRAFADASSVPVETDPIAEVATQLHPGRIELVIKDIQPASPTAKTIRFRAADGRRLPLFQAGQYMTVDVELNGKRLTRPYTISSAPVTTTYAASFVDITVRKSKGDGLISDYLYEKAKIGDHMTGTIGLGQFYYEPLRDSRNIIALAGGVGITPFASMAREIEAGRLDANLTILYGTASSEDIVLKEELAKIRNPKIRIVYVLSGDEFNYKWEEERGFITADLIRKYMREDPTFFVCGPQPMYAPMARALDELNVPAKRRRFEVYGQSKSVYDLPGYPTDSAGQVFQMVVCRGIREDIIEARSDESIVVALERAGIKIDTGCRSGECGFCRTKILDGIYYIRPINDGRRAADKDFNYVHACATYPLSDIVIRIPIE